MEMIVNLKEHSYPIYIEKNILNQFNSERFKLKIYSKLKINLMSFFISIIIYIFVFNYIPQLLKTTKLYIYYKTQPNIEEEYEE